MMITELGWWVCDGSTRRMLSSTIFCVLLFFVQPAQAEQFEGEVCHGVNPTASKPLRHVSIPPQDKCSFRLRNGFPIPDPACTPGSINPTVTIDIVRRGCRLAWKPSITQVIAQMRQTYKWYDVATEDQRICETNHLIPRQLGGADSLDNVWPICGPQGATPSQLYSRQKRLVDNYLIEVVRSGKMDLAEAQKGIATDWTQYLDDARRVLPHRVGAKPAKREPSGQQLIDLLIASTRGIQRIPEPTETQLELVSTDKRNEELTFGAARISVPEGHEIGQVERPKQVVFFGITLYRETEDEKKHFTIKSTRWMSQEKFLDAIRASPSGSEALIFVHGFNTSFDEGLFRLAQIVWDTKFQGVPILFSWPSRGGVTSYLYDRESARFSATGFAQLIKLLQDDTDLSAIHIIAHSMGNQIVLDALTNSETQQKALGQLLFAAPDVDQDVFKSLEPKLKGFKGITLYASSADKALGISHTLARGLRAGDVPAPPDNPVLLPKMDTIDATALGNELLGLNHDTFASSRSAIDDIGRLIRTGERPPDLRTPQIRPVPQSGQPLFWRYPD